MGLLDSLVTGAVGSLLGGGQSAAAGGQNQLAQIALTLIQQNGGVDGIISKFRAAGLGQHADSWVSQGPNPPVDASQVQQALGGTLGNLASQFGMNHGELASGIAQVLPSLIDKLTPNGVVPANHADLVSEGLKMLEGAMGGSAALSAAAAAKPAGT